MHYILSFRHLLFLCVVGSVLAGCANDEAPTAAGTTKTVDPPVDPPAPVVVTPMGGYWPLAAGNVWEFSYSLEWGDASSVYLGKTVSGRYNGSLRWQIVDTATTANGFQATIRERFIGQASESRVTAESPLTYGKVEYAIADSSTTFVLVIKKDSTLTIVNHVATAWDGGWFPERMVKKMRVPATGTSAQKLEQGDLMGLGVLTRSIGPTRLISDYSTNTAVYKATIDLVTHTIVGG